MAQTIDAQAAAQELVAVRGALAEAREEVERLEMKAAHLTTALRYAIGEGEVVRADGHLIYWGRPTRRPARRVDAQYAEEVAEVLVDLGVARRKLAPIKGADVLSREGALRAAGVDVERLLPDPGEGALELRVEVSA